MTCHLNAALTCRTGLFVVFLATCAHAGTDIWQTGSNNFWTAGDWSLGHPPTSSDSANFNQPANYNVYFDGGDATASGLSVSAGDVDFRLLSGSTTRTLNVTNASVVSGATLRLDNIILNLNAAPLDLNGTLNVSLGGRVTNGESITVGHLGAGSLTVDGSGSIGYSYHID